MMAGLRRLTKHLPKNRERLHEVIDARMVEAGGYTV